MRDAEGKVMGSERGSHAGAAARVRDISAGAMRPSVSAMGTGVGLLGKARTRKPAKYGLPAWLLTLSALCLGGPAWAEGFSSAPVRAIGPNQAGQVSPAPGGGWQPSDDLVVGASIGGQGGWAVNCNASRYDQEITPALAHSGRQSWRVSNWFHEGCVNTVLSPAFASVQEGVGPSSQIQYSFWFLVPADNDGLTVSSSLSDVPGARLTYAALRDVGGSASVQVVGIPQGSGFVNTLPAPFDDTGVEYDIRNSPALVRGDWYRLSVQANLVAGARNDLITYTIHDADHDLFWTSGAMDSWEDAYLAGPFASPGTKVTVTRLGWRIVENPDDPLNRNPLGTYALARPSGVFIDDLNVVPGSGLGLAVGFESDRYVAPSGTNGSDCRNPLAPCLTIGYAVSQAGAYNTIHIASGTYTESVAIAVPLHGLHLLGEGVSRPVIALIAGGPNQHLVAINGAQDVRIENIDFQVDKSFVGEAIIANGNVDGLQVVGNGFEQSWSLPGQASLFRYTNAISINRGTSDNSAGLPSYAAGVSVLIEDNVATGSPPPNATAFRACLSMDRSVGTVRGNDFACGTHDAHIRWFTGGASTPSTMLVENNTFSFRGLELSSPDAGIVGAIEVRNNVFNAPTNADDTLVWANKADYSLARFIGNASGIATNVEGNRFNGHARNVRGVLVENWPGLQLIDNVFTPKAGATDFVSLVLGNKEITSVAPANAPLAMPLTATGNTFNGSGVTDAGRAVELFSDNDAGGAAMFGALSFGIDGGENLFDEDHRWFFRLDDRTCNTHAPAPPISQCTFLDFPGTTGGVGSSSEVRPFRGNVSAAQNRFGIVAGIEPADMTPAQRNALLARTQDDAFNAALGLVDYGFIATQAEVYVDATFAGAYGDALSFTHGGVTPGTVYFGVNAFATVGDGILHVAAGGTVYIADGTYAETVAVNKPLQLVGNGIDNTTVIEGSLVVTASGVSSTPILFQDFIVTNPAGSALTLGGTVSHLRFEGVAFDDSSASAVRFNGTGNDHIAFVGPGCRFRDNMFGVVTASAAVARDVSFVDCDFLGNEAGIVLFGGGSVPSMTGLVQDWSITGSDFIGNNDDSSIWGGGLWLKTGGAGTTIDGFTVTGSTFTDNGSTNPLNRTGITVRARTGAAMAGVQICNNSFSETGDPGTQLTGINVYAQPGSIYTPIEVCSNNVFSGLGHSVSGLEQFTATATEPQINITGGPLLDWEYLYFAPAAVAYVDDDFAGTVNGDEAAFPAHPTAACVAGIKTYGVDAFATIVDALANVQSGGTICVAGGTYAESTVNITAPVSVFGAQAGLDARNRPDTGASIVIPAVGNPALSYAGPEALSIVNIESSDVVIDGFLFDGDNPGIATGLPMGSADPDVDSGIWAFGSRIEIRNNVVRNLVYAGIEGYNFDAAHPAREGNVITQNWIHNIDSPSAWGLGIVLLWNYYADVSENLLTNVRVGIQTNYFFKTAPLPSDALISNNEIHASRLGIYHNFHNAGQSQSSPFTLDANTIVASDNAAATGAWTGIFLQTLQAASTATVTNNSIDATALVGSGRLRAGYMVGQITTSLASSTAIDDGSVSAVDYGVLVTDGAFYGGAVNDILVRNVAFSDIAIAAIFAEDTALAGSETVDNAVKVTVGPGNTFAADVLHHGALSGPLAAIDFAPGAALLEKMLVRAAGDSHRGVLPDSNGNPRAVEPGTINDAIADAAAGGTVTVEAGTFAQNVVVDKHVELVGPQAGVAGDGVVGIGENPGARNGSDEATISPVAGRALLINADAAVVDGFTFTGLDGNPSTVAIGSGGNFGGIANGVSVRNNRFVALDATAIYTNGPANLANWTVHDNLFDDVGDVGSGFSAINLWKMDGATIANNTIRNVGFGGIQLNVGSAIDVLDNRIENTGNNGINVGPGLNGANVARNIVVNANVDGSSPEEGALTFYAGSNDIEISCNVLDEGPTGVNALSATDDVVGMLGSDLRIFHNAVIGAVAHNIAGGSLLVGSNWYAGASAPALAGSNAAAVLVADALAQTPIGDPGCGNNDAFAIDIHAGSSPQAVPILTPFLDLQARVTDVLGGAVAGQTVTFDAPGSGASAVLGSASGATDYNGVHRSTATANGIAGAYLVPASNDDAGSIDFALTNGKAVGTIELVETSFPYTGGEHVLAARIAEEPGTACTDITPATISDVGPHDIDIGACTGTNYDAPAVTLVATVSSDASVRRLRDDVLFDSVADGLGDPGTLDSDTLQMAPGVYPGPITITRPIKLIGADAVVNKAGVTPPGPSTIIDGGNAVADGVIVNPGVENVAIVGLEVRNFTNNCVASGASANGLLVQENLLHHCGLHGVLVSGIANIADVTIDRNEVHTFGGRGIVVWDGIKRDITITDNYVHNELGTGCCGIELQDGAATGVWATGNVVENTGDSGMAFIQLTSGSPSGRANIIRANTVTNTGRFGIEIKIPNGSGLDAEAGDLGDGAIVVEDNIIDGAGVKTLRDRAGIAVHRRSFGTYPFMLDATVGVIVRDNTVVGFQTNLAGYEGYGIVVEGLGSSVEGNTLTDNNIGLQLQQANPSNPSGDSDQGLTTDWFGRGNAPLTCVGVGTNAITGSTIIASRSVPASANLIGGVRNEDTGTWYCSIQAAINAATTVAGHTIRVYPGTYAETVTINKAVTLLGPMDGIAGHDAGRSGLGEATIRPVTGRALVLAATGLVVDGFTVGTNDVAENSEAVTLGGSARNSMTFRNSRVVDIADSNGIEFEPGEGTPASGFVIEDNLFAGINAAPSKQGNGYAIRLFKGTRDAVVSGNVFRNVRRGAVQVNGGNGSVVGVDLFDNNVSDPGPLPVGSSNAFVLLNADDVVLRGNTVGQVTTALYLSDGVNGIDATCNTLSGTGSALAGGNFAFGASSGVRILDNALQGNLGNSTGQAIIVGSNWYGGNPAPASIPPNLLVADALPGNPIGNLNCGNNMPADLVFYDGAPQTAQLNQPFAEPLQARVIDQLGGAVMGQTVSFEAPMVGASAGLTPVSGSGQSSNYNGVAQVTAIANGFAGTYDVVAAWTTESVDFSLTNEALEQLLLDLNGPVGGVEVGETVAYTGLIRNENDDVTENVYLTINVAGSTLSPTAPMPLVEGDVSLCVVNPGNPAQCLPIDFDVLGNNLYAEFPGDLVGAPLGTNFSIAADYEFLHNLRVVYAQPGVYTATAQVVGVGGTVYASDVISTEVVDQHAGVTLDINGPVAGVEKDLPTAFTARLRNTEAAVADNVVVEFVITRAGGIAGTDVTVEYYDVIGGDFVEIPLADNGGALSALFGPPGGFTLTEPYDATTNLRVTFHVAPPAPGTFSVAATVIDAAASPGSDGVAVYAADNHSVEVIEPDPDVSLTLSGVFDVADGETLVAANVAEPVIMRGELVNTGGDVADLVQASFTVSADYPGIDAGDIEASYWFVPIADACVLADVAPGDLESVTFTVAGNTLTAATTPQPLLEDMELATCFQLEFVNTGVYNIGAVIEDAVPDTDGTASYAADNLAITVADSNGVVTLDIPATSAFDGVARVVTVVTDPPGLDYTLTYTDTADGSMTGESEPPVQAGTYVVTATIDPDQGYSGSASGSLTITPKLVDIVLGGDAGNTYAYDGTERVASATVQPGDLVSGYAFGAPLQVTYNGQPDDPVNAGVYVVTATFDSSLVRNYMALPPISSIVILRATGAVNFAPLSGMFGTTHAVTASLAQIDTNEVCGAVTGVPAANAPAGNYTVTASCISDNYEASGVATYVVTASTAAIVAVDAATVGVVTVDPLPDANAKKSYYTWETTGAVGELVRASFVIAAGGDAQAGDLVIEYEEAMAPGMWFNLPLTFNATTDQWTGWFGPATGFPFTDGADSHFRATFARGGRYTTTSRIVGVSSGLTYATSAAVATDVAELELAGSGNTAGIVGDAVETGFALVNSGTSALSSGALFPAVPVPAQPAPNDENVRGRFTIVPPVGVMLDPADTSGPGGNCGDASCASPDVSVEFFDATLGEYRPIHNLRAELDGLGDPTGALYGHFGALANAGVPVPAGYSGSYLFRTTFLDYTGAYTVHAQVIGIDTGTVYAQAAPQAIGIDTGEVASIVVVGAASGSAVVGGNAYDTNGDGSLRVLVLDSGGNPVDGATVVFNAPASGATALLSATDCTTGADGECVVPVTATSGDVAGAFVVEASTGDVAPASFALTNVADTDPGQIVLVAMAGTPQTAAANQPFGVPLTVRVADRFGNVLDGQTVSFTAPTSAGASASLSSSTADSGIDGVASVDATANENLGSYLITASIGTGPDGTVTFSLQNTLATPVSIVATPGYDPQATILTAYATELEACVFDAGGDPVEGVSVTFSAPATGPSVVFADDSAGHGVVVKITADLGCVSSGAFSANGTAGEVVSVTAVASGLGGPISASYTLQNLTGAPDALEIVGGDGQSVVVGGDFSDLAVRLVDAGGNPIAGASVDFVATAAGNGASADGLVTPATTDAGGLAATPAAANAIAGSYVVTASSVGVDPVVFSLANTIGAITIGNIRWSGNDLTSIAYTGAVQDAAFDTDATLDAADCSVAYNGGAAPADAGVYLVQVACSTDGLAGAASAVLTIVPAAVDVTLGDLAHVFDGSARAASITTDPAAVTGVSLAYSQGGSPVAAPVDAGVYDIAVSVNNANYILGTVTPVPTQLVIDPATATIVFGGIGPFVYTGQPQAPVVDSGGVSVEVVYAGTSAAGVPYGPSATPPADAGDYTATATVTDANYTASPVSQDFSIAKALVQVTLSNLIHVFDGGVKSALATTSPLPGLVVNVVYDPASPMAVGSYDVLATVDESNYQGTASGTLTILAAAISEVVPDSLTDVTGTAGAPLESADLPTLRVLDANGDGVAGISVVFEVGADSGAATGTLATTDGDGRATVGSWTLDPDAGGNTMTALVPGQPGLAVVDFLATGLEAADVSVLKTSGTTQADRGDAVTYTITVGNSGPSNAGSVDILDALPDGFDAATATWICLPTGAALCTDVDGNGDVDVGAHVPVGDSVVITLTANVSALTPNGDLVNTAVVELTSGGIDGNVGNDSSSHTITVAPRAPAIFGDGFETSEEPAPAQAANVKAGPDAFVWTPGWSALGATTDVLLEVRGHGKGVAVLDGMLVGERAFVRVRQRGVGGRESFGAWEAVDKAAMLRFAWSLGLDGAELHFSQGKSLALTLHQAAGEPLPARLRVLRAR